ncbi:MAG TPA: adenylyl-sulfate reductase subunit beta [Polyangiaceae bacterium]|nr:adenylyl-sulfate reductase subunit beta [Polyangiaceae bacterium]
MPSYVIASKCDGCKALDRTACQYICPNDLMTLNPEISKAYNRDPSMCWECFNCVKICPTQAIEVRGYSDFVPMGATVSPMRSTDNILWTVQFRDPSIKPKRFRFPIRRDVAEGQVEPFGHAPTATTDLKSPLLMGEPAVLDTGTGPVQHPTLPQLDAAARKEQ